MSHDCTKEGTCTILHQSVPNLQGFHFLSLIDDILIYTYCVRLAFNALVWGLPTSSAVWLLACSHMRNSSSSIQKGLTFVRRMCWLSWQYNLWGFCDAVLQEEGQRQSAWGCQFQVVSVLDDCGNCCCLFGIAWKGNLCDRAGQLCKDPFAVLFSFLGLCMEPVSHFVWRVWRMRRFQDLLGVFLSLRVGRFFNLNFMQISTVTKLGSRFKTRYRCSPLLLPGCFMMLLVPTPFPNLATVIRTRHCRLRRSCVEGSSGPVGFKTAIFSLMQCELWHQQLSEMRNYSVWNSCSTL